jgi:signal transduction histidine kinase
MAAPRLARRHAFDAVVAALAVIGQLEIWIRSSDAPTPLAAVAALLATLPLLLRRRFPLAAPVLVFTVLAAVSLLDPEALRGGAIVGSAAGLAAVGVLAWQVPSPAPPEDRLIPGRPVNLGVFDIELILLFPLGAGLALGAYALQRRARHTRALEADAARLEGEREESARAAVAAERRRIARDLHDVVAHSVSVMTVQAGAARLLLAEAPERGRRSLRAPAWPRCRASSRRRGRRACRSSSSSTARRARSRPESSSPPIGSCRRR